MLMKKRIFTKHHTSILKKPRNSRFIHPIAYRWTDGIANNNWTKFKQ